MEQDLGAVVIALPLALNCPGAVVGDHETRLAQLLIVTVARMKYRLAPGPSEKSKLPASSPNRYTVDTAGTYRVKSTIVCMVGRGCDGTRWTVASTPRTLRDGGGDGRPPGGWVWRGRGGRYRCAVIPYATNRHDTPPRIRAGYVGNGLDGDPRLLHRVTTRLYDWRVLSVRSIYRVMSW